MNKYFKHFMTITKHRNLVAKLCIKCGYPLKGLTHDLSKYSPTEFFSSARYFQGDRSPINAEKEKKGYSIAWQHHKGHNPHHWEYWIDNIGSRKNTPVPMPEKYTVEMINDWIAAGIVYDKIKVDYDKPYSVPITYYRNHPDKIIHPDTKAVVEKMLEMIDQYGINAYCKYVRKHKGDLK